MTMAGIVRAWLLDCEIDPADVQTDTVELLEGSPGWIVYRNIENEQRMQIVGQENLHKLYIKLLEGML